MSLDGCTPTVLTSATTVKFNAGQFVSRRKEKISKHYTIKSALGSGGYGEVFLAVHKDSGTERAIKVIEKTKWSSAENEAVINEFNIVKDLDHPNLLKMYEMFEDSRHFYIVTDIYMGGELFDEIEANGAFPEEDTAILMQNVLSCVNYFHQKNVVHRDLKPENILLTQSKKLEDLKVIDFGLATYCKPNQRLVGPVGSAYYKAPELLVGEYGPKCDIWSCGVICFILLGGYAPFDGDDDMEIEEAILCGEYDFDDPVWDLISEDAKDFIEECLTYKEKHRPTAAEALTHPWLENIRKRGKNSFVKKDSGSIQDSLKNMASFHASSKLKQATLAFIAAQLLLKEEKEAIDEVFRALDSNSDGKLTPEEIREGYKDFYEKDLSNEELDEIFKRVNFRGTGAIDYSEFVVASMFEKDLLEDRRLNAAFNAFDKDGDGFIDAENIKSVLAGFGTVKEDIDDYVNNKIIAEFDTDGDGKISFEDFKEMMFFSVKQNPRKGCRRKSFLKGVDYMSSLDSLDEEEPCVPLPANLTKPNKRRGSVKEVQNAMQAMSIFDSSREANPMFKSKQRFASVRGGGKKVFPVRTTTREKIAVHEFDSTRPPELKAHLSGELKFMQDAAKRSSLIEESDEEELDLLK